MTDEPARPRSRREQLRAELRFMAGAFLPPFVASVLLFGLAYAVIVAFGETDPTAPSKAVLVPLAFGYGAFVGLWPSAVVGGVRLCWRLVGAWTLLPLLLVPGAVVIALWAGAGLLEALAADIWEAAGRAGAEREWLAASVGQAARIGPVILVVVLPLLLIDLGAVALDPQVLWTMFRLVATFALLVAFAVVPAASLSMLVLLRAYLIRLRARVAGRR